MNRFAAMRSGRRPALGAESLDRRELLSVGASVVTELASNAAIVDRMTPSESVHGERILRGITYTHHGPRLVQLDLYLPVGTPPPGGWPVILAFPGGGWRQASRQDYGGAVSVFTHFGYAVAGVDYTYASKSGGSSWPTNLQDAREAVVWVHHFAQTFDFNTNKIVAMGESSGAHLALLLGTYPDGPVTSGLPAGNTQGETTQGVSTKIAAVVDFYGPTNLAELYDEDRPNARAYLDTFLGGPPSQYPAQYAAASPLTYINSQTPPIFTVQGLADHTVKASQSLELDNALTNAGVPHTLLTVPWAGHGFRFQLGSFSFIPLINEFLNGILNDGPIPPSQTIGG